MVVDIFGMTGNDWLNLVHVHICKQGGKQLVVQTDKASMLDEVIEYLKTLQAQVHMMSRMSMPQMMMPMTMQQQLQMTMMAQMGMAGMGMGMGGMMDPMNSIGRPNIPGMPHQVLNPAAFMSMASWDGTNDRVPAGSSVVMPDPMASFLSACQTQPMTMDAYSRMAALFQQLHQNQVPNSKS
ncbi:Transcription factor une10 [Thalictrum thalictroides]|uniref:Transcription factor une10 n=1 Tax=Thalictrum thalictroides TaxID=46969 RepID=A0A7J6WKD0_THATH|nr:Transcription factor une10 [Thalictrum thalictroides]